MGEEWLKREDEEYRQYAYRLYKNRGLYGLSNDKIKDILNKEFNMDLGESTHRCKMAEYIKGFDIGFEKGNIVGEGNGEVKTNEVEGYKRPRLVVSDNHFPYQIDGYLEFLQDVHKQYNCDKQIIHLGDMTDKHALSRWDSHPDAVGDVTEFDLAKKEIARFTKVFPYGVLCESNHDSILERQVATLGVSQRYLKGFAELYELPSTWELVDEIIIDNVRYSHGLNCGGQHGHVGLAMRTGMSNVIGHYHSNQGIQYINNGINTIFGAQCGCLIDSDSLACSYGKHAKFKPTLGCAIIFNSSHAIVVPFNKEKYSNK